MCDMVSKKGKNQNIQVFVRLRPLNAREKEIKSYSVVECYGHKEVVIRQTPLESKHTKKFTFDRSFGPNSTQIEVYKNVVSPLIEEVLQGYSCTVFAYGQTGTGKTFTMAGSSMLSDNMNSSTDSRSWQNDPLVGIIPRALNQLFDELRLTQNEFTIRVSYLEIYNEELFDLLAPSIDEHSTGKIRIFDDPAKKGSVIVQGLEEVPVKSKMEVYKIMEDGQNKRKTAATLMNAQSSRSHTVFSILVHIKEVNIQGEAMLKTGKLNLVDLAGSENISKAGNDKKERARETVNINQSLLTLGRVISALVERTPHIPYRESKLTRLLQDSLGGRTKTSIIATISPGHKDLDETMSTLDYAHRAKNIMNKPEINQKLTQKLAIKGYTDEIDRLRKELFSQREKSGVYLANEKYEEMILRLGQQDQELSENLMKIRAYEDEISKRLIVFENLRGTLTNTRRELTTTKNTLDVVRQKFKETKKTLKKSELICDEKSHIIEIQAKTEQLLTNQALDLLNVAVDTIDDAEKLQNVIEKRRSIDHTIKTSTELFNERMKQSTETFSEIIDKRYHKCIEKNSEIIHELDNVASINMQTTEKMRENVEETFTSMKSIFEDIIKLEHVNCSKLDVSQNLHEQNNIKIDKTRLEIHNTFTKIFHILSGEMCDTYNSPTKSLSSLCDDMKKMIQSGSEKKRQIAEHIIENDDQFHITKSKIDETFTNQSSTINTILKQLQEKFIDSDVIRSLKELLEYTSKSKNIVLTELGKTVENTEKIFGCYSVTYDECQEQMDKFGKTIHYLNDKQQEITESIDNEVKRMVDRLDSVLLNVKNENISAYRNLIEVIEESYNDISSQHEACQKILNRKQKDLDINLNESCESLSQKVADLTARNEKLQRMITDLSGFASNAFDSIINDVGKYCFEELEIYSPTGQTPVRKKRSFSKSFACTSPHDRILERYRKEHGLNSYRESLDSSVIELDESDDEALKPVAEADAFMSVSEIKPICRWSSEANIKLSKEPPSVEKPKLTKSVSSIDFREIELIQFPEKENIPCDKIRNVSKYDRISSSIPVHTRDASKILSSRNN